MTSFKDTPIVLEVLPWTGKINGDDTGYRNVALSPLDEENPDAMERLSDTGILLQSVYAHSPLPFIYPFTASIGATREIWMREPAVSSIQEQNRLLKSELRQVLVVDGFRSAPVTARMWALIHSQIMETPPYHGRRYDELSAAERLQVGDKTEVTGAHVAVIRTEEYLSELERRRKSGAYGLFLEECSELGIEDPGNAMDRLLTYEANLGLNDFKLDRTAPTAHGNGGADDSWLVNTYTGFPTCNGVHYDYTGSAAKLDYFEDPVNLPKYQEEVAANEILRDYLAQFGIAEIDINVFEQIRTERRIWYHSGKAAGATIYIDEPWHSNRGNERGGNQFFQLPYSGNSCHALLKNVRDRNTGLWTACWTNEIAHRLVEKLA